MALTSLLTLVGTARTGFVPLVGGPAGAKHGFVKHAVQYVDSGVASAINTWEHIVWTVAADKKPRLYVNGVLVYTSKPV